MKYPSKIHCTSDIHKLNAYWGGDVVFRGVGVLSCLFRIKGVGWVWIRCVCVGMVVFCLYVCRNGGILFLCV